MTGERALRMMAGTVVLLSLALTTWVSPWWALLTAFVGLNLLQSAFTHWCPAVWFFEKLGLPRCTVAPDGPPQGLPSSAGPPKEGPVLS